MGVLIFEMPQIYPLEWAKTKVENSHSAFKLLVVLLCQEIFLVVLFNFFFFI